MNTKSRIESILKATSLDTSITGFPTFNLSELNLKTALNFQLPSNLRLGHLVERIISELIKSSSNYDLIDENIQLIENKKTKGIYSLSEPQVTAILELRLQKLTALGINEIEVDMDNKDRTHIQKTTPSSFLERYCSKLNINSELTKLCKFVAMKIQKEHLIPENTPQSIAAGIIYFVSQICNLNVSKKNVNLASNTSEVTINKCYNKLNKYNSQLLEIMNDYE